jgi:hypothetical protein
MNALKLKFFEIYKQKVVVLFKELTTAHAATPRRTMARQASVALAWPYPVAHSPQARTYEHQHASAADEAAQWPVGTAQWGSIKAGKHKQSKAGGREREACHGANGESWLLPSKGRNLFYPKPQSQSSTPAEPHCREARRARAGKRRRTYAGKGEHDRPERPAVSLPSTPLRRCAGPSYYVLYHHHHHHHHLLRACSRA